MNSKRSIIIIYYSSIARFTENIIGEIFDKGYLSKKLFKMLFIDGISL